MDVYNLINGELTQAKASQTLKNINPATGELIGSIPNSSNEDLDEAVNAAKKAFPLWANLSLEERSEYLLKISQGILDNLEAFAQAESLDTGKPISLARNLDIPRAAQNFSFFAKALSQYSDKAYAMGQAGFNYTQQDPIGIVGCISPWNLPLYLLTWKIAPALAAGNCVIAKPSELSPLTAMKLSQLCQSIGLPSGVLSMLHGLGSQIGNQLVNHKDIKAISFTGGTTTGQVIASNCAPHFKKLSLEMGGKNPNIIFDDCDLDKAVDESIRVAFANQGQICLCGSRFIIHESIYDSFKDKFISKIKALNIGDPSLEKTNFGAVISKAHLDKILSYIELAKKEGGKIIYGGKPMMQAGRCRNGFFVEPTVIEGLSQQSRVNQEEIFGPVVTLQPFKDEQQALEIAQDVRYGLSATIWSKDISRCHRVARALDVGLVWVNSWLVRDLRVPFGGQKDSGLGREGGFDALSFFTNTKNIFIKVDGINHG